MPNSEGLRFSVLGPVEVHRDGDRVALGGPRQRALLALLLTDAGRVVPADVLADELWAGEPPDGASVTLRSYVSRLRAALDERDLLEADAAGYRLTVAQERIDAAEFERLIRDARDYLERGRNRQARDALGRALAMWRGRPFGAAADDGRLRAEGERLEELRLHALELRLELDVRLGRSASMTDELESLVARHPHRERLWRTLMLALYHSGRQADALAAFHRARAMLDEHLGIDPGPDLQALEQQILRHEIAPVAAPPRLADLPTPLTSFIGRADELENVAAELRGARLITLTGVGGVGKTRLALESAQRAAADFADGAVFVDLAPVAEASGVPRAVARAVGSRDHMTDGDVESVAAQLRDRQLLMVLDNCEHVATAAADTARVLLATCPELKIVATSRTPLGLVGEVDISVSPLPIPAEHAPEAELREADAVRLLLDRASAVRGARGGTVAGNALSAVDAARICRDLDGIPLAIELAAARAKALSLAEIATRLDDRFRFLVSWRRVAAGRHQTLRHAMDWSYELLSPGDQSVFAQLAVFVGGFTLDAAAEVCVRGDRDAAVDAVSRIVDASLVVPDQRPDAATSGTRYRTLKTVREYAATRLREAGNVVDAQERHAAYFAGLAAQAEAELSGSAQTEWLTRLDSEHDNMLAALSFLASAESAGQALLEFTVRLTRFWYIRGHLSEARERLARALAAAPDADLPLRRRALTAAASIALLQGDYSAATEFAEDSLAAARQTGEDRLVANGLSNLGAIVLAAGDQERAGQLLDEAVELARGVGDGRILALALNNLADHALTVGEYQRAEPLFAESLELLRERGDTANVARSLYNLGAAALKLGRLDEARARLRDSLVQSRAAGDKEDLCWCLVGMAALAAARGEGERAARLLGAADGLLAQIGGQYKPFERRLHDDTEVSLSRLLIEDSLKVLRAAGAAMATEDVLDYAAET